MAMLATPVTNELPTIEQEIGPALLTLRKTFDAEITKSLAWRRKQLNALIRMMHEAEDRLVKALADDLGKPYLEAWAGEIHAVVSEAQYALKHLKTWTKARNVLVPVAFQPARSYIQPEPLGVALIIAPWNYPVQLAFSALVGAIAAGNCAIIKPSELAPHTADLMAELCEAYLDPDAIRVINGGIETSTALLAERFDTIFYTGSTAVGRIVMTAAAKHLTPVTLELGGKSPCIVLDQPDIDVTARRIVWGKFFNAGQTCIAPDYVLVEKSLQEPLLQAIKKYITQFYGSTPRTSPDFARIVNLRHHQRLCKLLRDGRVVIGGETSGEDRFIAPTVLADVSPDAPVMQEEIFGPILPVIAIDNAEEAIQFVRARPKPLALYIFTGNAALADDIVRRTSSGGVCINECLSHAVGHNLPFGGVGESGMGAYHGKTSFDTFSHMKSVMRKPFGMEPPLRYPPYSDAKTRWIKRLI